MDVLKTKEFVKIRLRLKNIWLKDWYFVFYLNIFLMLKISCIWFFCTTSQILINHHFIITFSIIFLVMGDIIINNINIYIINIITL
jgi:hypothetical protein